MGKYDQEETKIVKETPIVEVVEPIVEEVKEEIPAPVVIHDGVISRS